MNSNEVYECIYNKIDNTDRKKKKKRLRSLILSLREMEIRDEKLFDDYTDYLSFWFLNKKEIL